MANINVTTEQNEIRVFVGENTDLTLAKAAEASASATTAANAATTAAADAVRAEAAVNVSGYYATVSAGATATSSPNTFLSDESGELVIYDEAGTAISTVATKDNAMEVGRVAVPSAPTVAINATAGNLTGAKQYTVTFVTADGETQASAPSSIVTPTSQQVDLTIPVSADSRVTARKIYRSITGSQESRAGKLVATINDNTTTSYTDNIADGSLGANTPWIDTTGKQITDGSVVLGSLSSITTRLGQNAHPGRDGYANTAIGALTMQNNAGGTRNTAVGVFALDGNTTGYNNTAIGVHAFDEGKTNNNSVAIGYNAAFNLDGAQGAVVIGSRAANEQTSGNFNVVIGQSAAQLKTGGAGNVYIGQNVAYAAGTGGSQNVAIGQQSQNASTTANFNTTMGWRSGYAITTGTQNVALGWSALSSCATGSANIAIGPRAGQFQTGSGSLIIDSYPRTNLADEQAKALLYGKMAPATADQFLKVNGLLTPLGLGLNQETITGTSATVSTDVTLVQCNSSGAMTATLPTGSGVVGKVYIFRNLVAQSVSSASANIRPQDGSADTADILPATDGAWAVLVCRASGTAYDIIMSGS